MKAGSFQTNQALSDSGGGTGPRARPATETTRERLGDGKNAHLGGRDTRLNQASGQTIERLLTVAEAASFLRIHPRTLYDWVHQGRLPCLRAGGRIRFTHEMLIRWLRGERRL